MIHVLQAIDFDKGKVGLCERNCPYMQTNKAFRICISKCMIFAAFNKKNGCLLSCVPQADLGADAELILIQVAKAIKEVHKLSSEHGIPPLVVSVEGHTNCKDPAKQSSPYHMQLSKKRAVACRKYLERAG